MNKHDYYIARIMAVLLICLSFPLAGLQAALVSDDVQIKLIGDRAGDIGEYMVSFYNQTALLTAGRDKMAIQFPAGTVFSKTTLPLDSIKVNGQALTTPANMNGLNLEFVLPISINQNEFINIDITSAAGVVNTTQVGTNKTVDVLVTIVDPVDPAITTVYQSTTEMFTITGTQLPTIPVVTLSNTGTRKISDITLQFKGALNENDLVYILLPTDFTFGNNSPTTSSIKINGKDAKKVELKSHLSGTSYEKRKIELTVPNGVATQANSDVTITISQDVRITNPSAEGNYPLSLYTSRDIVPRDTAAIEIRNQPTNVTVQFSPNQVREIGEYTIQFKATGVVSGPDGYLELRFPSDTIVPASISSGHVLINNSLARLVERDGSNARILRFYLPAGVTITAGQSITLLISSRAGIQNPSQAGTYSLQLRTSTDQSYVSSNITVVGGQSNNPTNPSNSNNGVVTSLKLSNTATRAASRYEITYRTSMAGALLGGTDEISITFNTAVQLPSFIDRETIKINSIPLDTGMVRIKNHQISFRLPSKVNIGGGQSLTILIDEQAGILNPEKDGYYSLSMSTSKDGTSASYAYAIMGQASYGFYVQPNYDADKQITQYYMTFKTNSYTSLVGGYDWVSITLPKALTRAQMLENNIWVSFKGEVIDPDKVQVSNQTITFFVPEKMNISQNTEVTMTLNDPNKFLSTSGSKTTTTNSNSISFKIMTSKDQAWTESNPITVFKNVSTQSNPTTPPTNTGTSPTIPIPETPTVSNKIILYLNKTDAFVGSEKLTLEAAPYAVKGNTMVPIRFISEGLGAKVEYIPTGKKITITYGAKYMVLTVGSDIVVRQGGGERLPVPVEAKNNRSFVPLRFISEWMGISPVWNQQDQSITLQK